MLAATSSSDVRVEIPCWSHHLAVEIFLTYENAVRGADMFQYPDKGCTLLRFCFSEQSAANSCANILGYHGIKCKVFLFPNTSLWHVQLEDNASLGLKEIEKFEKLVEEWREEIKGINSALSYYFTAGTPVRVTFNSMYQNGQFQEICYSIKFVTEEMSQQFMDYVTANAGVGSVIVEEPGTESYPPHTLSIGQTVWWKILSQVEATFGTCNVECYPIAETIEGKMRDELSHIDSSFYIVRVDPVFNVVKRETLYCISFQHATLASHGVQMLQTQYGIEDNPGIPIGTKMLEGRAYAYLTQAQADRLLSPPVAAEVPRLPSVGTAMCGMFGSSTTQAIDPPANQPTP